MTFRLPAAFAPDRNYPQTPRRRSHRPDRPPTPRTHHARICCTGSRPPSAGDTRPRNARTRMCIKLHRFVCCGAHAEPRADLPTGHGQKSTTGGSPEPPWKAGPAKNQAPEPANGGTTAGKRSEARPAAGETASGSTGSAKHHRRNRRTGSPAGPTDRRPTTGSPGKGIKRRQDRRPWKPRKAPAAIIRKRTAAAPAAIIRGNDAGSPSGTRQPMRNDRQRQPPTAATLDRQQKRHPARLDSMQGPAAEAAPIKAARKDRRTPPNTGKAPAEQMPTQLQQTHQRQTVQRIPDRSTAGPIDGSRTDRRRTAKKQRRRPTSSGGHQGPKQPRQQPRQNAPSERPAAANRPHPGSPDSDQSRPHPSGPGEQSEQTAPRDHRRQIRRPAALHITETDQPRPKCFYI